MTEEKKTANPKKTASNSDDKAQALEKKIEDMNKQIEALSKALEQKDSSTNTRVYIDSDEDIDVISLCNNKLNLATEGLGKGQIYRFFEFGQVVPIPYKDLKEIIVNNRSFYEKGYFAIDSSKVVSALRLSKIAEKLPTFEDLTNVFKKDISTAKKILKMTTKEQKEMLAQHVIDKLMHNENVDMNLVKIVGDAVSADLAAAAKDKQELMSEKNDKKD
jgi:hypothetical protein